MIPKKKMRRVNTRRIVTTVSNDFVVRRSQAGGDVPRHSVREDSIAGTKTSQNAVPAGITVTGPKPAIPRLVHFCPESIDVFLPRRSPRTNWHLSAETLLLSRVRITEAVSSVGSVAVRECANATRIHDPYWLVERHAPRHSLVMRKAIAF